MRTCLLTAGAVAALTVGGSGGAWAQSTEGPLGEGLVMYMQMGGNPGDGDTLPRTTGARDAAKAFGVTLSEQYSASQPETMLNPFRAASAANPDFIGILGPPGSGAFPQLVAAAVGRGVGVPSGNQLLNGLFAQTTAEALDNGR